MGKREIEPGGQMNDFGHTGGQLSYRIGPCISVPSNVAAL